MMHKHRCGRAAVRIFLPPLLHWTQHAFWLVETSRKRTQILRAVKLGYSLTFHHTSSHLAITRLLLCRNVWGFGEARLNLRPLLLLPFRRSHFPRSSRKYSVEDIGVRMAAYKIVLIRHGESCWNQENRFCGWFDADLSETGEQEAKRGGQALKGTVSENVKA